MLPDASLAENESFAGIASRFADLNVSPAIAAFNCATVPVSVMTPPDFPPAVSVPLSTDAVKVDIVEAASESEIVNPVTGELELMVKDFDEGPVKIGGAVSFESSMDNVYVPVEPRLDPADWNETPLVEIALRDPLIATAYLVP